MIYLITAFDSNHLIGKNNQLPWHYPKDLSFFKKITINQNVLMGYQTYLSLKNYFQDKPFNFQKSYVASLKPDLYLQHCEVVWDLLSFFSHFASSITKHLFVIGGSQIYKQSLPYVDKLYITHILNRHQGDIYFPPINWHQFRLVHKKIEPQLIFATYQRIYGNKIC